MTGRSRRLTRAALALTGLAVVLVGLLHLPLVQHAIGMRTHGAGACPFGYGSKQHVATHQQFRREAAGRPALGFTLGVTTETELQQWAQAQHVQCREIADGQTLECAGIPAGLVDDAGTITTCWFELDDHRVMHALRTVRRTNDATRAAAAFTSIRERLGSSLGPPTAAAGTATRDELAEGTLSQAMVEFLHDDYVATIRVTNMGDGFALTESYAARPTG